MRLSLTELLLRAFALVGVAIALTLSLILFLNPPPPLGSLEDCNVTPLSVENVRLAQEAGFYIDPDGSVLERYAAVVGMDPSLKPFVSEAWKGLSVAAWQAVNRATPDTLIDCAYGSDRATLLGFYIETKRRVTALSTAP